MAVRGTTVTVAGGTAVTATGGNAAGCTAATDAGVGVAAAAAASATGGAICIRCFVCCEAERSAAATRLLHRMLCLGRRLIHEKAPRRREQPRESGTRSLARAERHDSGALGSGM